MTAKNITIGELMESARALEKDDSLDEAAELYSKVIAEDALHATAYDRLMIIYRKQKEYRKELQLINKAIKAVEDDLRAQQQQFTKTNRKAAKISHSLASKLGLVDKKGSPVYERELEKWRKRKQTVTKRLDK